MIVSLKSTPLPPTRFGSPILTIILDPRPSVDMVLPVMRDHCISKILKIEGLPRKYRV